MAPKVHLIRHAEGIHNLSTDNHGIIDPVLTDRGKQQSRDLAVKLASRQAAGELDVGLVLASPLTRTISTALIAFEAPLASGKLPSIRAWPAVQEVSDVPCDRGSPLAVVSEEFGQDKVDFGLVEEGWEHKRGKYINTEAALLARAQDARRWLKELPHAEVAVVSHLCFLHLLTDDWENCESPVVSSWPNAELRSFTFAETDYDDAALVETPESRLGRGCTNSVPFGREEQMQVRTDIFKMWREVGEILT